MSKKTFIVLLIGSLMTVLGIARGELSTVLNKAINLCLECVGIG